MSSSDPKLVHLVRKFLSFSVDDHPNADHIVHCLRTQHREYQRKDLPRLKRQVQKVLKRIARGDDTAVSIAKKRSLEQEEEDQYERKARKHDIERNMHDSSALNASLIERYRKLQQERDDEAAAAAAAAAPAKVSAAVGEVHVANIPEERGSKDRGESNKSNRRSREASASKERIDGDAALVKTPSSKALKRKKTASTKQRYSSSNGIAAGIASTPSLTVDGRQDVPGPSQVVTRPTERYSDLGGMEGVLKQIKQLVEYPLVRPELYRHLGVDPPRGVLLRGPPGCGKTHLANAIAGQLGLPYFRVSAPELVSGMSGESEARIRDLFQSASDSAPCIVFLDELDAIAPKRNDSSSGRGMEKRMVAQLLTSLDMLDPKYNRQDSPVIVLGATNNVGSIDPALRRAGRFDKEILLGVPDEDARIGILKTMTQNMKLSGDLDFKDLARRTPGYVGADIRSLTKEAAVVAINRIFKDVLKDQHLPSETVNDGGEDANPVSLEEPNSVSPLSAEEMEPLNITMDDFLEAIPHVQPSSKREGFATVPGVSWDDIGALGSTREELTLSVLEPIRNPEKFKALGIPLPAGVMLYGPPGCGKTLLAKAIANESGANFISVKGPELLDKYVGESERSVRLVFERARSSSPCVVFFDELDSLCPKRGSGGGGGGGVSERVVNQLLTEMDGLESRRSVFVIAATNRPELIDPAMMRPGRLDKMLYVPVPTPAERASILKALSSKMNLAPDIDLQVIGRSARADGYSGADCAALLREAGLAVLKEGASDIDSLAISQRHIDYAFDHVVPSVSVKDQTRYNRMRDRIAHARSRGAVISEIKEEDDDAAAAAEVPQQQDNHMDSAMISEQEGKKEVAKAGSKTDEKEDILAASRPTANNDASGPETRDVIPATNAVEVGAAAATAADVALAGESPQISNSAEQRPPNGTHSPPFANPSSSTNMELEEKPSGTSSRDSSPAPVGAVKV